MMKLQIDLDMLQLLKKKKEEELFDMVCIDIRVYNAAFHVQWEPRTLCEDDPGLRTKTEPETGCKLMSREVTVHILLPRCAKLLPECVLNVTLARSSQPNELSGKTRRL